MSHSAAKDAEGFKDWGLWDQFIAKQFAYFINRLKETREADGGLLSHKAGQFVTYDEQKHCLANLFVRMANAIDVPIKKFGDSTGIPMSELFV